MSTSHLSVDEVDRSSIRSFSSSDLSAWLAQNKLSLGLTTYQSNGMLLLHCSSSAELSIARHSFDRPMGLDANTKLMRC